MKKNDTFETKILDLTIEGSGVCRIDNMAVFVPGTAVGDRIRVKIVKVLKSYAFGIVDALLEASPDRIVPACRLKQCGGCVFQHVTYEAELRIKEKTVQDAFTRIGKLSPEFLPILGGQQRTRYRNKAQYPFALDKDGKAVLGFFARRSHRVIPVDDCLLQPELFDEIAKVVLEFVRKQRISIYDEKTEEGDLRHLYLRCGQHSGEVMVCLIVRNPIRKKLEPLVHILTELFPDIRCICMNCNPKQTNVILGDRTETLWGSDTITDTMCGNEVELSPESFYQVNTLQAERLYGVAKEFAQLTGGERLLDLYCGAGTIGLFMADQVKELVGVEIVPEAIRNAKKNAQRAGISNAQFFCGDAGTIAKQLVQQGAIPDVITVDPPRKGCDDATIQAMVQMQPKRIVMISCNPATAARDCAVLDAAGYEVKLVRPVDLFPETGHVETVVLLSREFANTKEHVYIDYEPESNAEFPSSVTYEEIKAWIQEEYGLKVSSLYIAQVKQKHGIIERECYNKPKSEGHRVPQCPPEKEAAIEAALKHFKLI